MFKKIIAVAVAGVLAGTAGFAQDYPSKPVTLVIPFAAGGSTETMARVFGKSLSNELGQNVIVRVRPGAGGAIGATEVSKAEPDGYTVIFTTSSSLMWPPLTQDVEYSFDSFDTVARITNYQQALVAKADAPFNTLDELISYSKDKTLSYGDQSTLSRAFTDYIAEQEGIEWNGIPTKGGGEMVPFLLGGKIDFAWSGGVHGRYGDTIKVLLSMNSDRLAASPDVPSIAEKYGISMPSEAILAVPAGTPADVIAVLAEKAEAAMEDAEFQSLMTEKLLFPLSFLGTEGATAELAKAYEGLKKVAGQN
ncbi:tripartite tricarboxylate transporter substrate binding protein [Neptunicoccus cionae]|uniref:tripartite tricarboxylate transporter substrate binding protein n=1 Tax=Neptunicoccus cionae TaxID=2035344 RepID=UPI000C7749FD|nr:tripartite tricarboxylate transporter substrate binding protein [Amylibacter cionae]PLS21175.1 tripartite tricarboxylate transporter substrate binding protein [Amylibacter cionae]